ncbi:MULTISPECIES: aKG-HExxH-type peptide beta-hydroxylase [Gordonia]|uniref:aKG-HExxH-type peptide beta-hydroxylase n=1 Tax=Gordonia TaxID=2053 RepID=UPI0007EA4BE6|nr:MULTISPECIES: HEXXH motif-containing putative peptide modification protein [Gordonia]OBA31136.1 hypothetical protein A5766_13925 [Gordonia sp. 852002-51296_SCH5728562-b]
MTTAGDPIWMRLADLDVEADLALGIYDVLSSRLRASFQKVAKSLQGDYPELSRRIEDVLDLAPQVLSYGAAYQWITSLHSAIRNDDLACFTHFSADFVRFSAAAAMLSGANFVGKLPHPDELTDPAHATKAVAIPLVGAFELEKPGVLAVANGRLEGEMSSGPRIGGLRVDAFETTYRLPRSKSLFTLDAIGNWELAQKEVSAAGELSNMLVPGLFDRYLTDVVPLTRERNLSNAGTDEAAPFVVYSSFERSGVDLIACFAHEEAHALINTAEKLLGHVLPDTESTMPVPWKPGVRRSLSNVIHGLVSFGRAAQVRGRALSLGVSDAENEEARERESGWVRDVTAQLRAGILGPLPKDLTEWLAGNEAALESAPSPSPGRQSILASGWGSGATCPWTLFSSAETTTAVTEQYPSLAQGEWLRGSGDFRDQDRRNMHLAQSSSLRRVVTVDIPSLIRDQYGAEVDLVSVKAHRLRAGDSIRMHTDHHDGSIAFRAIMGASPALLAGGELRLSDSRERPVIGLPLRFGDTVVLRLESLGNHDVTRVESDTFRYTIIATYRHRRGV